MTIRRASPRRRQDRRSQTVPSWWPPRSPALTDVRYPPATPPMFSRRRAALCGAATRRNHSRRRRRVWAHHTRRAAARGEKTETVRPSGDSGRQGGRTGSSRPGTPISQSAPPRRPASVLAPYSKKTCARPLFLHVAPLRTTQGARCGARRKDGDGYGSLTINRDNTRFLALTSPQIAFTT